MPTVTGYTPTNTPPTAITLGSGAGEQIPPADAGADTPPPSAIPLDQGGGPQPLPQVPGIFTPAFTSLTDGDKPLAGLTANASDIGRIIQGTVEGVRADYEVCAGTDAQAIPGFIRPANFNASTNAVVFAQRA